MTRLDAVVLQAPPPMREATGSTAATWTLRRGYTVYFSARAFRRDSPVLSDNPMATLRTPLGPVNPLNPRCYVDLSTGGCEPGALFAFVSNTATTGVRSPSRARRLPNLVTPAGRLLFELFVQRAPRAAEAFRVLCAGGRAPQQSHTQVTHGARASSACPGDKLCASTHARRFVTSLLHCTRRRRGCRTAWVGVLRQRSQLPAVHSPSRWPVKHICGGERPASRPCGAALRRGRQLNC